MISPVRRKPAPVWPHYDEDEIAAVANVLRSGKVNQWTGTLVGEFEQKFAQYIGVQHGVAVANGTIALELALRALRVGPGDEVVVTGRSFIASASCVDLVGATPVFADVEYETGLISASTIEPHIGPRTKAILPVHLYGRPCDMPAIMELARRKGLIVVEDCAQSHGASVNGQLTGSFGDAAAFSFCGDKIMSTGGEGGMILFADGDARDRAWALKDHGKSPQLAHARPNDFEFRWLHEELGTNGRMLELQAAIGLIQLGKLEDRVKARGRVAERLSKALSQVPFIEVADVRPHCRHAYYRFEFRVETERSDSGADRDGLIQALNAEGIKAFSGVCPEIYLEVAYLKKFGRQSRPNSARLARTSVAMLSHHALDDEYISDCERAIEKVCTAGPRHTR
jgi:dTDP-4-amino-4,6-dideoxygalactose transaminase